MAGSAHCTEEVCQLVLFAQENAWQTGVQGKKASVAWMREFIWQERRFICGRNPVSPEQRLRGSVLFRVWAALLFLPES